MMGALSGKDIILFVEDNSEWKAIAYSTECEISINADTIDANLGGWSESTQRRLSWTVKGEYLVPSVAPSLSPLALAIGKVKVKVSVSSVAAHPGVVIPAEYVADTRVRYTGYGYISNFRLSANNGDKAVYALDITGTGALSLS